MASKLSPHTILLVYWLVMIVFSAFFLRMACSLCRTDMPSWRHSFISVVLVTFLAYLVWDFSAYLVMRTLQDILIQLPPGYGYNIWFREAIGLKWFVISHAGPLRYLPFIFALCAIGVLQVIVLQAEVTFRMGLFICLLQWAATLVAGYIVSLLFGVGLEALGWKPEPPATAQAHQQTQQQPQTRRTTSRRVRRVEANRPGDKSKKGTPDSSQSQPPASDNEESQPNALLVLQHNVEGAMHNPREYFSEAGENIKDYANSHLEQLTDDLEPLTKHLPQPVLDFLDRGGWWGVLAVLGIVALFWLRWILRKLRGALGGPRRKKKKIRSKSFTVNLKVNLRMLGEGFNDPGPQQVTVKGMPARLRLVILSLGTRNAGHLSEEMADRVLDWIKPGLAEATAQDYPRVRVWPPFFSADGFATALAANVAIPELKGERSHWVLVSGAVKMGKAIVHVGLGFYTDETSTLRYLKIKGDRWTGLFGVKKLPTAARVR